MPHIDSVCCTSSYIAGIYLHPMVFCRPGLWPHSLSVSLFCKVFHGRFNVIVRSWSDTNSSMCVHVFATGISPLINQYMFLQHSRWFPGILLTCVCLCPLFGFSIGLWCACGSRGGGRVEPWPGAAAVVCFFDVAPWRESGAWWPQLPGAGLPTVSKSSKES